MAVFWDVPPCSLVEIDRRIIGATASIIRTTSKPRAKKIEFGSHFLITLMMEAVNTSETSVNFYQSKRVHGPTSQKTAIFILTT
jgi:hypothetical protein